MKQRLQGHMYPRTVWPDKIGTSLMAHGGSNGNLITSTYIYIYSPLLWRSAEEAVAATKLCAPAVNGQ